MPYGSTIMVNGNQISINGNTITATAADSTELYTYAFSGWSVSNGSTITSNTTITANFTRSTRTYTVSFAVNSSTYGSVSTSSISVPYGASISVSGNSITINDTTVTATAASTNAQYSYSFSSWSNTSGTITSARTITANFTRNTRTYTVTFATSNSSYGSVSRTSLSVPYGSSISTNGNVMTINGTTITATAASSTTQYEYSFSGWSSTSGTITGSRTITASFTYSSQHYTVSIASSNSNYGSVSLSSISVPYGVTVSSSGDKLTISGSYISNGSSSSFSRDITATTHANSSQYIYSFDGWTNASGSITGARTITANFSRITIKSLTQSTWEEIKQVSSAGKASTAYKVGDEKSITLTDGTVMTLQIAGFNHDVDVSGNSLGITFVCKDLLPSKYNHNMNSTQTNTGGWKSSEMRTYLNSDIYALLPNDLKSVITAANKKTTLGDKSTAITTSEDKLFLLSCSEVNINTSNASTGYKDEGATYELYKNAASSDRKKCYTGTTTAYYWWLRSPNTTGSGMFSYLSNGNLVSYYATDVYAICFAFCV